MKIMFILIIWFVLTGNTEMSLFSKKVHSSKGKSKHLDRRRWLFNHSPHQNLKHWQLKKSKPKFLRTNEEIYMPYRTFRRENKYKHVKSKQIQEHNNAMYPKKMLTKLFNKKRIEAPFHQQVHFKYNDFIKRKGKDVSATEDYETKNLKANNLVIHDQFKSKIATEHTFPFNRRKTNDNFNKDHKYAVHLKNRRRQFALPFFSGTNFNSKSSNFITSNENINNKSINSYSRDLRQTSAGRHVLKSPKYLILPVFYNFTKAEEFQDFSVSMKDMNYLTSELPFENAILPEYKQPATNVISYSAPPNNFELELPIKSSIYNSRTSFNDKLQTTGSVFGVFPGEKKQMIHFLEAFRNSTLQHPKTPQELNKYFHKQFFKKRMSNASNSKMYNQLAEDFSLYNKTTSSNSSSITSTEMSSLQYLHHKLKDIKSINSLIGSNRRAILFIAAVIVFTILVLLSRAIYKKRKIGHAFKKKNKFTFLWAKNKKKRDLLKRIFQLKCDELGEDIEE